MTFQKKPWGKPRLPPREEEPQEESEQPQQPQQQPAQRYPPAQRYAPKGGYQQPQGGYPQQGGYQRGGYGQQAYAPRGPTTPTFQVQESVKTQKPYLKVGGKVSPVGRGGFTVMLFPSDFEGSFLGMAINSWGRGMIPIRDPAQVSLENGIMEIDLGWAKLSLKAENAEEAAQFLEYAINMPKQPSQPRAPQEAPQKRTWGRQ